MTSRCAIRKVSAAFLIGLCGTQFIAAESHAQWGRDAEVERGELPPPAPAPQEEPPFDAPGRAPGDAPSNFDTAPAESQSWPDEQPHSLQPPPRERAEPEPQSPAQDDSWGAPQPREDWAAPDDGAPQLGQRRQVLQQQKFALPADVWRGAHPDEVAAVLGNTKLPNPTPTLHRLIAAALSQPGAQAVATDRHREALRKAGAADALVRATERDGDPRWRAMALLAAGQNTDACALARDPAPPADEAAPQRNAPPSLLLVAAWCAAAERQLDAATLSLDLAREARDDVTLASAVIGRLQFEGKGRIAAPDRIGVLDAAFLALGDGVTDASLARAEPLALARLARDENLAGEMRVAAAERAAALNIETGETLAAAYRAVAQGGKSPAAQRAALFWAAEDAASPAERAQAVGSLFNSVGEGLLDRAFAQALGPVIAEIVPSPEMSGFAETGLRIAMLSGDFQNAAGWAQLSRTPAGERWRALLAVAAPDPQSAQGGLDAATELAVSGRLPPKLMHRLVTVLDALGRNVPIPLWEKASATAQPSDGFLPQTGVLTALKETAEQGETGLTILLAATALGPDGASGANLLALGDTVRALDRVGLRDAAQSVALDALYPLWLASDRASLR